MKKIFALLAVIALMLPTALAGSGAVVDSAKVLSKSQELSLQEAADEILETYNFYIMYYLTDKDMSTNTLRVAAADAFEAAGFGPDGAIFAVSTTSRQYYYVTAGTGMQIFGDYEFDELDEQVLPYLRKSDYPAAATMFVRAVREVLDCSDTARLNGSPAARMSAILGKLPIAALIGAVIASIAIAVMIGGMKTGHGRSSANDYVVRTDLSRRADVYLYTTQTRRRIETSSSGSSGHSGGGGSSFHSSSGTSYGGRGGSFCSRLTRESVSLLAGECFPRQYHPCGSNRRGPRAPSKPRKHSIMSPFG